MKTKISLIAAVLMTVCSVFANIWKVAANTSDLGEPIELTLADGDIAVVVKEALAKNPYPQSLTVNLAPGGHYTVSESIMMTSGISIIGDAEQPATIDLSTCDTPMIMVHPEQHPSTLLEELGFNHIGDVHITNVMVKGLKTQLFYANKVKALINKIAVDNCVIQIAGGNKTTFDFNSGGVVGELAISNSTIYAQPAHSGQLYSSQSGQKATDAGLIQQIISIQQSTLANIAYSKNVATHRSANQAWLTYIVKNNIVLDCGKRGQFVRGLNGGQSGANPTWVIDGNSFQWTSEEGVIIDSSSEEITGDDAESVNNNIEGALVFEGDYTTGDFTLGDCPQHSAAIGDPRWLKKNADAIGEVIVLTLENGQDIATQLSEAMTNNKYPEKVIILLEADGQYRVSSPIVMNTAVEIVGEEAAPATIDCSALEGPMMMLSEDIHPDMTDETGNISLGNIRLANLQISGLRYQLFYANKVKALFGSVVLDNSVVGIDGSKNKTIFDFAGGGNTSLLAIRNSTIYAIPSIATNGGFFSSQSGSDVPSLGGTNQQVSILNSTLYGICTGKTVSTLRKNSQNYMTYEVKKSLIVDCGKRGQFLMGLNAGQPGANCTWDVAGNSFQWSETTEEVKTFTDICGEETCGGDASLVKDNVMGDVVFVGDINKGDFTLGECAQRVAQVGDPRWLAEYTPPVGKPIVLNPSSGEDLAEELSEAMATNKYPERITIHLMADGQYTLSSSLLINTAVEIVGDESAPASIDCSALEGPMVLLSEDIHSDMTDEKGNISLGDIRLANLLVKELKYQLFYANKVKALFDSVTLDNSVVGINGSKNKTIFDFAFGGNTSLLTIRNSTIYAIPSNSANGGFFSSQSGHDVPALGGTTQQVSILNSTLYGICTTKTLATHRRHSQNYMSFEVKQSLLVDCGKRGQFLVGLNAGQPGANCTWEVSGNSFQWSEMADGTQTFLDISGEETCGDDPELVKECVEGVVAFDGDITKGDFTLADCPQNDAKIGDPRWINEGVGITDRRMATGDSSGCYTIQGIRVMQPQKGIYIRNGKKVVVK